MGVPPTAATGWARLEYLFESIPYVLQAKERTYTNTKILSSDINWISFTLGAGSLLMFILLRELKKKFPTFIPLKLVPSVLIAVAAAILLSWGLDFDGKGVPVLGEIPS